MAGRILIIDDEEVYRSLCMRILGTKYTVMSASNGREALDLFRKFRPALLLVDILMPGMNGFEFVEALDKEGLITDVPVVYMTSDDAATTEPESFRHGGNDYIHKPFVPDVLLQRIANIMRYEETKRVLRKDADIDEQTQLLNRRATVASVNERMADPLGAFLMLDVDYFKEVNDCYGHEMGDRILVGFADVLRSVSRRDDIIGRIGGDEFVIYLDGKCDDQLIAERCQTIIAKLEYTISCVIGATAEYPYSVSIGIAHAPDDGSSFQELYSSADKALYHVKQNGKRGYYFFDSDCNAIHDLKQDDHIIDIMQMRMLVGEGGNANGVYNVNYQDFKNIYRFLARAAQRDQVRVLMLIFTLPEGAEALRDDFRTIVHDSLRKSDVASPYGRRQYIMLLMDATADNGHIAADRVLSRWKDLTKNDPGMTVTYELQEL